MPHRTNTMHFMPWEEAKHLAARVNPELVEVINQIPHADEYEVLVMPYQFGELISERGQFNVNYFGETTYWKDRRIPHTYIDKLHYNWAVFPFGLVLENSFESYLDGQGTVYPNALKPAGGTFSALNIFEDIDNTHNISHSYSISAGSRSFICLIPLADLTYNVRLAKHYGFHPILPKTFAEQYELFYQIAHSPIQAEPWHCQVLLFTSKFVNAIRHTIESRSHLLTDLWHYTGYYRNQHFYDLVWSDFLVKHASKAVRNNPYITEQAKHVIKMILGEGVGFIPCTNNLYGPFDLFTQALIDHYQPRHHYPIFMHIARFTGPTPVYYSLQHPIDMWAYPAQKPSNALKTLAGIQELVNRFLEQVHNNRLLFDMSSTKLFDSVNQVQVEYFHPKSDSPNNINLHIEDLFQTDGRFTDIISAYNPSNLEFPTSSNFFNGCVKISKNNNNKILR